MPSTSRPGRKKGQAKGGAISPKNTAYENLLVAKAGMLSLPELMKDDLTHAVFFVAAHRLSGGESGLEVDALALIARKSVEAIKEDKPSFFRKVADLMDETRSFLSDGQAQARYPLQAHIYAFASRLNRKTGKPKTFTKDELLAHLKRKMPGANLDQIQVQIDRALRVAGISVERKKWTQKPRVKDISR